MNLRIVKLGVSACLLTSLLGCKSDDHSSSMNSSLKYNGTYTGGFDTVLMMTSYGINQEDTQVLFDNLASIFQNMSNLFDIYNDYEGLNNLKTINDNAAIAPVKVDQSIIDMLNLSKQLYDLSGGEFDVTAGALLKVWHNYREIGLQDNAQGNLAKIPSISELQATNACKGWDKIEIDEQASTVYINDPCVSLDVGGIAKGFATELMQTHTQQTISNGFIINAGGNSALVHSKNDGSEWTVGIANPSDPNNSLFALTIDPEFNVVTSGDYQRYFVGEDEQIYAHIIDPSTLYPPRHFRSVSIICEDSGIADGLSTILFTMPYEQGLQILEKAKEVFGLKQIEAIWIFDESCDTNLKADQKIGEYSIVTTENVANDIVLL